MDPMNFAKLLRIEEFVKSPVATQTEETLAATRHEIETLKNATLETDGELKKLIHKYSKTPFLGSSKLPPGSSNVKISVSHPRYVMSRLHTLRAHLHLLYGEVDEAIAELRMSTAHCVRSAEACELLGGTLRLSATCQEQMEEAEKWLLRAIDAGKHLEEYIQERKASHNTNNTVFLMNPASMYDEQRLSAEQRAAENAGHRLLLLLCQTSRCEEADRILRSLGFRFRLSEELLNYNLSVQHHVTLRMSLNNGVHTGILPTMAVCDDALPPQLLVTMQQIFAPESSFWRQHYYDPLQSLSRSVGFFSYVYPFKERRALSVQEQVIDRIRQIAVDMGVDLSQANYAEWWVHSRVHGAGHQMHYDSDEKHIARGGAPKHPLFSTVVYLCEDVGGPTCVTDQKLNGTRGTKAWICMPKMNRVLFFDATYLHGVLPGVGPLPGRRLSFMVGWWPAISSSILTGEKPGAAHCYPPIPGGDSVPLFQGKEEPWYLSHGPVQDISYIGTSSPPIARNIAEDVVLAVPSVWTPIAAGTNQDTYMQTDDTTNDDDIQDKDYELLFQGF